MDVNKQVVYGKDSSGKVIGRSLFVLTDEGRIQTFNPYCHDEKSNFKQHVQEFAKMLAASMNTEIVSDGNVRNLVADNWYDDGAIEVGSSNQLSLSQWCQKIAGKDGLSELEKFMAQRFRPHLTNLFLETLFEMSSLDANEKVFESIMAKFRRCSRLNVANQLALAIGCYQRNSKSVALDLLGAIGRKGLRRFFDREFIQDFVRRFPFLRLQSAIDMISDYDPSFALKVLRAGRPKRIRSDLDVQEAECRKMLSLVHRKLGRFAFADKLLA